MSNGHHPSCDGCVTCADDTCPETAYCVNEWPVIRPCPHNEPYCDQHNIENCADCRRDAEHEMYQSGHYDPRADPFYLPEKRAEADHYWHRAGSHFDPVTNSYRYPKGKP